ncbi:MAG: glycosyltransferase family 4 protein [Acidobacteria bacterium]|nr:glycosyltransferase family 4 protein [Acidobacteriota bacterium]
MSLLPTLAVVLHTLRHAALDRLRRAWHRAFTRERKLRIGVDIRPFYEPLTGIGWYLYYLLHELAKRDDVELVLFGDARITDEGPRFHVDLPPNAKLEVFDLRGRPKSRFARPLTAGAYVLLLELADCDVVFGANYFLPRLMSAIARRRVVTVHDLTYKRFPELLQQETLDNLDRQMQREVAQANAIVCVSEATRADLLRFYEMDPSRAFAIHSGLGTPPTEEAMELPARYILFVSTIEPRKNLGVLLDAFARLRARSVYDGELVVVGRIGWKSASLAPRLKAPGVRHLDYVNASRLAFIYRNAEAFVFPSIFEGFGFPLLEAMGRGVPTIAARSSSLPEIGGDAALYFSPTSVDELEAQLARLLTDPALRAELAQKGRDQAARFRWDVCAAQTLEVLRRAAGHGPVHSGHGPVR